MTDHELLKRIPFFAEVLDEAALDQLAKAATRSEFDHGTVLIREGDPGESMFVIVRGALGVAIRDGGKDRRVATLHDDEIVGEMSLLTGAPRAATVTALRPTETLEITRDALKPILDASPELAIKFSAMVLRRSAELDDLYGQPNWLRTTGVASDLTERIRRFFGFGG
jgi:CRP-like cAMP-binding protein